VLYALRPHGETEQIAGTFGKKTIKVGFSPSLIPITSVVLRRAGRAQNYAKAPPDQWDRARTQSSATSTCVTVGGAATAVDGWDTNVGVPNGIPRPVGNVVWRRQPATRKWTNFVHGIASGVMDIDNAAVGGPAPKQRLPCERTNRRSSLNEKEK